jgi:hypothetical protein
MLPISAALFDLEQIGGVSACVVTAPSDNAQIAVSPQIQQIYCCLSKTAKLMD